MAKSLSFEDVQKAAERINGHAVKTPLLRSGVIDEMTGKTVWFKPECNQKVGAFKYRGAYNRLSAMSEQERKRGVVATSSGNHAQGVSRAAKELNIDAVIVMPTDAPKVKVAGVQNDGAHIVFYDRLTESREEAKIYVLRSQRPRGDVFMRRAERACTPQLTSYEPALRRYP